MRLGTVDVVAVTMEEREFERVAASRPRRRRGIAALLVASLALLTGCASTGDRADGPVATATATARSTDTSTTTSIGTTTSDPVATVTPTTAAPAAAPAAPAPSVRDRLALLVIDDRPSPDGTYRREDWPHWSDTDGNGCDARQDALVAWSVVPATVDRAGTCKVVAGSWVSPYDGRTTNNPSDVDVDHLVPLENAFVSGGWRWTAGQRRAFANEQAELVVTSATSNRSKGSKPPNEWRPTDRASWCAYAVGWVEIKQRWSLTATTAERDALGQMLDTCTMAGAVWPGRG